MNPVPQSKNTATLPVLIALMLACFGLSPQARAVCQEGCLTNQNTVLGDDALLNNTTGDSNTAIGFNALFSNTTGNSNTAVGYIALSSNTIGLNNTATGYQALQGNTTGLGNTANGSYALPSNTIGDYNTATGEEALLFNVTGNRNTATGSFALQYNDGHNNTATGYAALNNNSRTANNNTATGFFALFENRQGKNNVAEGFNALLNNNGNSNIAVGANAGSALTTGNNNIDIGNVGVAGEASTIRIGTTDTHTSTYIAGIYGAALASGSTVRVDSAGHLGTVASSARFKKEIKPMDKASEAILALQPVTFRYKKEIDATGIPQFGLIAEEVEKVNPNLIERDQQGKPYTVRYEAVNAMLLNEFLKEHRKVETQDKKVQQLETTVARLEAALKEQAAQLQKVNEKVELGKPAPRMVTND